MKKFLMSITIFLFLCSSSYATVIFSDNFEGGDLSLNWTGKTTGSNAAIVAEPIGGDNALSFTGTNSGGDIFTSTNSFSAGTYWLSFDYLGTSNDDNSGGYVGISNTFLPTGSSDHVWYWATGTVSGAEDVLIDDGAWHSYTFQFTTAWNDFHLMLEDFVSPAGDAFFDNISLSNTAPVPEPATMLLFGLGLLGLAGVSRKKNQ